MGKIKRGFIILVIITILLVLMLVAYSAYLNFGANTVMHCQSSPLTITCGCNSPTESAYRCDNADVSTYDNDTSSMTIDGCQDGLETMITTYSGYFYELVKDIQREDLNGSSGNPYQGGLIDNYLRAEDTVRITVTLLCADGFPDNYSILYKNNTDPGADWQSLEYGSCISSVEGASEIFVFSLDKQLDNVIGNHTIRALISYGYDGAPQPYCGTDLDPYYSDTDDFIFEVIKKVDLEAPEIIISGITDGQSFQFQEGQTIPFIANITDQTAVDFVNISIEYDGSIRQLGYTQIGDLYYVNITNLTSLGEYTLIFYANDTIPTNSTTKTQNHVNNYTIINFFLKNDVYIGINKPDFYGIYKNNSVLLDFTIKDIQYPYKEVYYTLNGTRVNLSSMTMRIAENNTADYLNNSYRNLSQSFNVHRNFTTKQFKLFAKRSGLIEDVSLVRLVLDNVGPFGQVIAQANLTNISNASFSWVNVTFNEAVNLSANTTYWLQVYSQDDTINLLVSYNNTYANGYLYENNSVDISMEVSDLFLYNASVYSQEGSNTLWVFEKNSLDFVGNTSIKYYVDLSSPYFASNPSYTSQVEYGSAQSIIVDVKDAISPIAKAVLLFNNTNMSMTYSQAITGGSRFQIALLNLSIGSYNLSIYANDTQGWGNSTQTYFFTVNDTTKPALTNINYAPNTTNDVDPNVTINFSFVLSDINTLNTTLLQYRPNTSAVWQNASLRNITAYSFVGNFTPSEETTYYYRVYSKDAYNNSFYSENYTLNAHYERDWSLITSDLGTPNVNVSQNITIANLTINYSGDVPVTFNILKPSTITYYMNFSNSTFTLSKGQVSVFVDITAPLENNAEIDWSVIINCSSRNCQPANRTSFGSFLVGWEGPFLSYEFYLINDEGFKLVPTIFIDKYPIFKIKPNTNVSLFINITNDGSAAADNISNLINFSTWNPYPTINTTDQLFTNFSLGSKNDSNNSVLLNINFSVITTPGLSIRNTSVTSNLSYNNSALGFLSMAYFNITNNIDTTDYITTTPTTGGGNNNGGGPPPSNPGLGGGNAPAASAGLAGGLLLSYNLSVSYETYVDLMRGANKTVQINISNPYKNKYFAGINLTTNGYYKNQIAISPAVIDSLNFNETKTFNVTLSAPSYLGYSVNDIELVFDYLVLNLNVTNMSRAEAFSTKKSFRLIISQVNRNESMNCLQRSADIIRNATAQGYNADGLKNQFDEQRSQISKLDFTLAKKICDQILADYQQIMDYDASLSKLEEEINSSIKQGYDLSDVQKLYGLVRTDFNNGEYSKVENGITNIENTYLLSLKVQDSNLWFKFKNFVKNNFKEIIITLVILAVLGYFVYVEASKQIIKNKILNLKMERDNVSKEIEDLQRKYYDKHEISPEYFKLEMEKIKEKNAQINDSLLTFETKAAQYTSTKNLDVTAENERRITQGMAELQKQYYVERMIDKDAYEKQITQYKRTLSELKKQTKIKQQKNNLIDKLKQVDKKAEMK